MSQRSNQKRKALLKKKGKSKSPKVRREKITTRLNVPGAYAIMRTMHLNFGMQEKLLETAAREMPTALARDAAAIQRVENAPGLNEVLELTPEMLGFAEIAWFKRMRSFGSPAAPVIAQWFRSHVLHHPGKDHTGEHEKCIMALGWCGAAGIEAIADCWDDFDDYGRSIACMMLGLLGAHSLADKMWDFYQQVKDQSEENLFVGALWGLIELQDHRVADELLEFLMEGRDFYEIFGFLARAGDQRAVLPLLYLAMNEENEDVQSDASWAVCCIGHRIGRHALIAHMSGGTESNDLEQEKASVLADRILLPSEAEAKEYFSLFYKAELDGSADDIAQLTSN
jgi:hypothetical protein